MEDKITLRIDSDKALFEGYRFMWIRSVKGFNPQVHCAKCFKGNYININPISPKMPYETNKDYHIELDNKPLLTSVLLDGKVLHYFCIVSQPYKWEENIHAGFIFKQGSKVERDFKGQHITLTNAKEVYFDDSVVQKKYNHLGKEFTTCRNFQFGAYYYG